ncbi:MAG: sugar phosphate isomerase/epimerase family protein, partial [Candidatus Zipacnadales bacterium]
MKLSFMTWVCPNWNIAQIIAGAIRYGYDGVEPRVECKQAHGIELDTTKKQRQEIKAQFADCGIEISCLATSRTYALAEAREREASVALTKRYIDLAADVGAPCLRVFGGQFGDTLAREEAHKIVAECLHECAEYAALHQVTVCLETHDAFSRAEHAAVTVKLADHPYVGICWDIMHPFRAGNTFEEAFEQLKPFVRHCHVHDGKLPEGPSGPVSLAKMGEGDIPHEVPIKLLASSGFQGHLSGEWIN